MIKNISADWTRSIFSKIQSAPFSLTLWDGKKTTFGKGKPQFHINIKDSSVIMKALRSPSLGFAESYMDGSIEIGGSLNALLSAIIENEDKTTKIFSANKGIGAITRRLFKPTSVNQQKKDISHHYDLGNEFYKLWLDKQLLYSCAYFKNRSDSIDKAQIQKIDYSLAKLRLKRGERLLDVGCGWGAVVIAAAKKYGVYATGITLSKNQFEYARQRVKKEGLEKLVKIEYMDYREIPKSWQGKFDKWISIGMYEHVGKINWPVFMNHIDKVLKPGGVGMLHSIASQKDKAGNPFVLKYIFPGGYIPPIHQITADLQTQGLYVLDLENLWHHYALTLDRWTQGFDKNIDKVKKMYDERFVRMWRLYLVGAAESFRHGRSQIVQIVFTNNLSTAWPLTRIN